jgi:hypothetical protein
VSEEIVDGVHRGCRFDATQRRIRLQGRVGHRRHGSEQRIATPGLVVLRRQSVRRRAGGRVERIVRVQEIGELATVDIPKEVLLDRVFRVSKDGARRGLQQTQGGGLLPGRRGRRRRNVTEGRHGKFLSRAVTLKLGEVEAEEGTMFCQAEFYERIECFVARGRPVLQTKKPCFDETYILIHTLPEASGRNGFQSVNNADDKTSRRET